MRPLPRFLVLTAVLGLTCFARAQISSDYVWKAAALGGGGFVSGIVTSTAEPDLIYARTDVGGAYRWNAGTESWTPLSFWVSENETGLLGVESLAIDPQSPNRVYMLAGTSYWNGGKTAILVSSDYGANFTVVDVTAQFTANGNGMGRQTGERLSVDPNDSSILFCGSRASGLFRSLDSGLTWSGVPSFPVAITPTGNGVCFVIFDRQSGSPGNPTPRIYAGVSRIGSNLFVSSNFGTNWSVVLGSPTNFMPNRAVLTTNGVLVLTYANAAGPWDPTAGDVWKLNTLTGAWTRIAPFGYSLPFGGVSVDPANSARIVVSTLNVYQNQGGGAYGDKLFQSSDGGASWRDLGGNRSANGIAWAQGASIHWAGCLEFDPAHPGRVFVTSGNGIFMTENVDAAGPVWKFVSRGVEETVPLDIVSIPSGRLVTVIGDYDGCSYDDVSQYVPVHQPSMGTTSGVAASFLNTSLLVRSGSSLYYSTDQGSGWSAFASKPGSSYQQGRLAVSADGTAVLWCPNGVRTNFRTVNHGQTWTRSLGVNSTSMAPVADLQTASRFYVYNPSTGSFYRSTNAGVSFGLAGNTGGGGSKFVRCAPGHTGHVWVARSVGGLSRTTNGGASFSPVAGVTRCDAVGFGKRAPYYDTLYPAVYIWGTVAGVTGIFRSVDEGLTWTRINDDSHEFGGPANGQFVTGDMNIYGRVYMSSAGLGTLYGEAPNFTYPQVLFLSPTNGSIFLEAQPVTLSASASKPAGNIVRVEYFANGSKVGESTAGPSYTLVLSNLAARDYFISARATDDQGKAVEDFRTISVLFPVSAAADRSQITNSRTNTVAVTAVIDPADAVTRVYADFSDLRGGMLDLTNTPLGSSNWICHAVLEPGVPGGVRALLVRADGPSNSRGLSVIPILVIDRLAPGTVSGVIAEAVDGVRLTWTAATDETAIAGYGIVRRLEFSGSRETNFVGNALQWDDPQAVVGRTYDYSVFALDTSSNSGPVSAEIRVTAASMTGRVEARNNLVRLSRGDPDPVVFVEQMQQGSLEIRIFDSVGELVRKLVSAEFAVGGYTFAWDLKTDAGRTVASGVYLVSVVRNAGKPVIRKIVVIR